jgi:7-cyano-7-deazaguanine synthase
MSERKKAVVLLSGGLDSATVAAIAQGRGFQISAITFSYGQRHDVEIESAKKLAVFFNIKDHIIIELPEDIFNSALMKNSTIEVPKKGSEESGETIPVTYVPARNILFLSYALAYAESIGARDIFIGANAVDYSGYPDCRPEFIESFNRMANTGTKAGISGDCFNIEAPLLEMEKSDIIKKGAELGVDYSMTHSCYDPDEDGVSCGICDSCTIRRKGFSKSGIEDPVKYRDGNA